MSVFVDSPKSVDGGGKPGKLLLIYDQNTIIARTWEHEYVEKGTKRQKEI